MNWNHDMSAAPRDPKVKLVVAHPTDGKVYSTVWNEPTKHTPNGWWSGFTASVQPVAWAHWPEHPFESPRKAAEAVSERTATQVGLQEGSAEATREGQPSMTVATSAESASNDGLPVETAGETAPLFILDDVGSGA